MNYVQFHICIMLQTGWPGSSLTHLLLRRLSLGLAWLRLGLGLGLNLGLSLDLSLGLRCSFGLSLSLRCRLSLALRSALAQDPRRDDLVQNAVLAHTRVDVMAVEMGRSEFRTKSTVGIMLNDCVIDTLVVGGPAFNSRQIRPGATILKIDGKPVSPENITTHLIGVDIPGSEVAC